MLRMNHSANSKGMTLVELLVVVAIASVVSTSLVALIIHSIDGWSMGTSYNNAASNPTIAMQKLCNEIRDGRTAIAVSNCLVVTYPLKLTDTNTQEKVYDPSANSTATAIYYLRSNGNLVKSVNGNITIIAKNISTAVFGANGGTVSIKLKATDRMGSQKNESTQQVDGSISLRNYKS